MIKKQNKLRAFYLADAPHAALLLGLSKLSLSLSICMCVCRIGEESERWFAVIKMDEWISQLDLSLTGDGRSVKAFEDVKDSSYWLPFRHNLSLSVFTCVCACVCVCSVLCCATLTPTTSGQSAVRCPHHRTVNGVTPLEDSRSHPLGHSTFYHLRGGRRGEGGGSSIP